MGVFATLEVRFEVFDNRIVKFETRDVPLLSRNVRVN